MRFERASVFFSEHPRFGPTYTKVSRQPGWVMKLALAAAVLVVVVPIVMLVLAAVVVAAMVFMAGSVAATVLRWFSGDGAGSRGVATARTRATDGRENVRVVRGP
jgi:cobalamin synthase